MIIDVMGDGMIEIDMVEFAKALADDTRQKIMALCCCQTLSVTDIVAALDVAQPTVSHHLKVLRNVGLVKVERRGKQVFYTLNQERLAEACCTVAANFAPEVDLVQIGGVETGPVP